MSQQRTRAWVQATKLKPRETHMANCNLVSNVKRLTTNKRPPNAAPRCTHPRYSTRKDSPPPELSSSNDSGGASDVAEGWHPSHKGGLPSRGSRRFRLYSTVVHSCTSSSSIYRIPNTEHTAYRLVRTLVYKRGVGIREKGFWVAPRGEDVPE